MKRRGGVVVAIVGLFIILVVLILVVNRQKDLVIEDVPKLEITSPAFEANGKIPIEYTGNGKDISPELHLSGLDKKAASLAVIMDDSDHPLFGTYNHWLIWNLPIDPIIPAGISSGKRVPELMDAVQGIGYGHHRYRGPKPPFGSHRYKYHVFVLDTKLKLPASAKKKDLLEAMKGHILQHGFLMGVYAKK